MTDNRPPSGKAEVQIRRSILHLRKLSQPHAQRGLMAIVILLLGLCLLVGGGFAGWRALVRLARFSVVPTSQGFALTAGVGPPVGSAGLNLLMLNCILWMGGIVLIGLGIREIVRFTVQHDN